jgi:hypothetical protein
MYAKADSGMWRVSVVEPARNAGDIVVDNIMHESAARAITTLLELKYFESLPRTYELLLQPDNLDSNQITPWVYKAPEKVIPEPEQQTPTLWEGKKNDVA